ELRGSEFVLRKHALDGLAQDLRRTPGELLAEGARPEPAGIPRVAVVDLRVELRARHRDLLRVDDDDEVAGVDVRRVLRLPLPAQRLCNAGRQTTEGLALGVDDEPLALDLAGLCGIGLHSRKRADEPSAGGGF